MNKYQKIVSIIIAVLFLFGLARATDSRMVVASSEEPTNYLYLDATFDPETKTYSLAGLSKDQLKLLGIPELQNNVWEILKGFDSFNLAVNEEEFILLTDEKELLSIDWDEESRKLIYALIDSYGVKMNSATQNRAEEWLGKADLVVNLRNSPDRSETLVIDMDTLLRVNINQEGKVFVEGFDVGTTLPGEISQLAETGDIENVALCLSKGVLHLQINGKMMPMITVYEEGLAAVERALKVDLGDLDEYFKSQIGASISFAGGDHTVTECEDIK